MQRSDGMWECVQCGFTLDVWFRGNCQSGTSLTFRERIERETAPHINDGTATQTAEQITATLDKCFGGCPKFEKDIGCKAFRAASCKRYQLWIERLVLNGCKRWRQA